MNQAIRKCTAAGSMFLLIFMPSLPGRAQSLADAQSPQSAPSQLPLRDYLQKPYEELFVLAPSLTFSAADIEKERQALKRGEDSCRGRFKDHSKLYGKQLDIARKDLKKGGAGLADEPRHALHCQIQNLELLRSEADVLSGQAIPNAYDNLSAKLDLLMQWPEQNRQTLASIADGSYNQRRWSDLKDIGFREVASGQRDDIKRGQEAVNELKRTGLLPPEVENKAVQDYVKKVAERVAQHSDLKVPLHVTVLQSKEINAFALPGGYLFIERGLLEAVDDESQLAGVISHELAHVTARHSAKLMKRATIAGIFYQAAQIAAVVLTGGVAGIGMYYALQYGYYGLGLVLNLQLLGVSRDYELEADQLGIQYAWNSGYDASGFIRFFDKMATKEGYVNGVSWFRTHPPFYARMVQAQREIMFLPKGGDLLVQTTEFEQMKKDLAPVVAAAQKEEKEKPSLLLTKEEGCAPPQKIEYKPGQPIERLCSTGPRSPEPPAKIEISSASGKNGIGSGTLSSTCAPASFQ
ncbi:MAG TPA: M48 family metalloprotease [Terracidiphilus sp.]|nr:M48 family metalloprotease [Terracidiphilus sp.]